MKKLRMHDVGWVCSLTDPRPESAAVLGEYTHPTNSVGPTPTMTNTFLENAALRILHTISSLDARAGGPAVGVSDMTAAQAAAGLDISVVSSYPTRHDPSCADPLRARGVKVTMVGPATGGLDRHPDIKPTIIKAVAQADIVHIHGLWEEIAYQAAVAAQAAGKPFIITPHGMLTPWSLDRRAWKKKLYLALRFRRHLMRAAALHFISERERQQTAILKLPMPSIVEPLGIHLDEFETLPAPGSFRARFPQIGKRPLIVFLGRIFPAKGLEYLIPAMAKITVPGAILAIVGPDSPMGYQATVEAMIDRLGLRDRIILTGAQRGADRIAALADADIFGLPSDHENFGLAVVESLASGTPVVISPEVAISQEIVAAGVGSAIPRDPDAVAAELTRWLTDRPMRDAAAALCRPFVWRSFDWKQIAPRWKQHYAYIKELSNGA